MLIRKIIVFSGLLLLFIPSTYCQDSVYVFPYNHFLDSESEWMKESFIELIFIDSLENEVIHSQFKNDSGKVVFNKTTYYPDSLKIRYQSKDFNSDVLSFENPIKEIKIMNYVDSSNINTYNLKIRLKKNFELYDLLIFTAVRHLIPKEQEIQIVQVNE